MRQTIRLAATTVVFGLAFLPATAPAAECSTTTPAYEIGPDEAQRLYDCVEAAMIESYSRAVGVPGVPEYRDWQVVSATPFVSATHGSMMINHIVNPVAEALYIQWEDMSGKRFAEGSILAKESYRVTVDGGIRVGPLFLMEKMPAGFNPASRDWRYTMIMPDGSLFGQTNGPNSERVVFCITCHQAAGDENDHLFFIPEVHRIVEPAD